MVRLMLVAEHLRVENQCADPVWFGNAFFLDGDDIGVATEWRWPNPLEGVCVSDLRAVQEAVADGRWRENSQAKDWVGRAVAEAMGLDASDKQHRSKIVGLLKIWKASGALVDVEGLDAKRETRTFVEVGTLAND